MWCATNEGAIVTKITFQLATAITDDGEGGDATGVSSIVIPARLVPISGQNEVSRVIENDFPGENTYDYVFYGWVNDRLKYKFPKELRQQKRPVGTCELPDMGGGRIQCNVGIAIEGAAKMIGEKFTALWTVI